MATGTPFVFGSDGSGAYGDWGSAGRRGGGDGNNGGGGWASGGGDQQQYGEEEDVPKLFLGQLPRDMGDDELRMFFEQYGPIREFVVLKFADTGKSKAAANRAQDELHLKKRLGDMQNPLQVKPAFTDREKTTLKTAGSSVRTKLFVGQIPFTMDDNELTEVFSEFGEVDSVHIMTYHDTGKSKGCGFVNFASYEDCVRAIEGLNGKNVGEPGRPPLVVQFAETSNEKNRRRQVNPGGIPGSGGPYSLFGKQVAQLGSMLGAMPALSPAFGMLDPTVLQHMQAMLAGGMVDPGLLASMSGGILQPPPPALMGGPGGPGGSNPADVIGSENRGPPGSNLFVNNLPYEVDDMQLFEAFGGFGRLVSVKVFVDRNTNQSKGFGFVSFDNPMSAYTAAEATNGTSWGTRNIRVTVKEEPGAPPAAALAAAARAAAEGEMGGDAGAGSSSAGYDASSSSGAAAMPPMMRGFPPGMGGGFPPGMGGGFPPGMGGGFPPGMGGGFPPGMGGGFPGMNPHGGRDGGGPPSSGPS